MISLIRHLFLSPPEQIFQNLFKNTLKRRISAMKRAKNITIRERNRLKSPESGYKRR